MSRYGIAVKPGGQTGPGCLQVNRGYRWGQLDVCPGTWLPLGLV